MATEPSRQQDLKALQQAFEIFSQMSGELDSSYRELESRVAGLQARLQTAEDDRRQAAERNAELTARLDHLIQALPGAVVVLDDAEIVRQVNTVACDLLGRPLEDTDWPQVQQRAFPDSPDQQGDFILQDGRKLSLAQKLLEPGPGRILLFTDVTENRKLEELLTRQRRLVAMGEVAAALAHQIRTPLSSALLYVSNAAQPQLSPDRRAGLLDKSIACLHDLEKLIADMLEFARGARYTEATVDLNDLFQAVDSSVRPNLLPTQALTLRHPMEGLRVTGSRESLTGALINLVNSAVQAAGPNARVHLAVETSIAAVDIRVRDNGPGVPEAQREKIFEPFYTSRPDGTGLGLAVARSVARAHNGDLFVSADQNQGATFVIRLPRNASLGVGRASSRVQAA